MILKSATYNYILMVSFLACSLGSMHINGAEKLTFSTFQDSGFTLFTKPLLKEVYRRAGIDIEIIEYPSARALKLSDGGEVDGEVARLSFIEKKFTNLIRMPVSIGPGKDVVFALDQTIKVNGWDSLKNIQLSLS